MYGPPVSSLLRFSAPEADFESTRQYLNRDSEAFALGRGRTSSPGHPAHHRGAPASIKNARAPRAHAPWERMRTKLWTMDGQGRSCSSPLSAIKWEKSPVIECS